jgi:hypothetical protein
MDATTVRIVLTALSKNNPSQFEPHEPSEMVQWLRQRIHLTRNDKGGGDQYNPEIEAAALEAQKAVSLYQGGDPDGARVHALEAMKAMGWTES